MSVYAIPNVQKSLKKINDIPAALEARTPSIATINKKFGEDFIQAYIEGWIVNLCDFVNIGKRMSDSQVHETAIMIVDEYYNLTIADINLIFKKAKLGHFGQFYDRLDGQVILLWFGRYFSERCRSSADKSIREADSLKNYDNKRFSEGIKEKEHKLKIQFLIDKWK